MMLEGNMNLKSIINNCNSQKILKRKTYLLPFILFALTVLVLGCSDSSSDKREPSKAPPPKLGTEERLRYEIKDSLGSSNRYSEKVSKIKVSGKNVEVYFAIDDNITEGLRTLGAKSDVEKILQSVQKCKYDYSQIYIVGSFPLIDKFGNTEEKAVIQAKYKRSIVDKINWEGFLRDNLFDIADSKIIHPEFK